MFCRLLTTVALLAVLAASASAATPTVDVADAVEVADRRGRVVRAYAPAQPAEPGASGDRRVEAPRQGSDSPKTSTADVCVDSDVRSVLGVETPDARQQGRASDLSIGCRPYRHWVRQNPARGPPRF